MENSKPPLLLGFLDSGIQSTILFVNFLGKMLILILVMLINSSPNLLIIVGRTIIWGGCSRKQFRKKRSHKGKEMRMRGHLDGSWLKRSEGGVGDAFGRNWRRRRGKMVGRDKDEEGDVNESKHAMTKEDGYEDARGGWGDIRWEVQALDMGGLCTWAEQRALQGCVASRDAIS